MSVLGRTTSSGIDAYFQDLQRVLGDSLIIQSQTVLTEKRTHTEGYVRGDIVFTDNSRLHFRELVTTEPTPRRLSYTYHYMRADNVLVFRYDDAEHFPQLPSAPHHKHLGDHDVVASSPPDLQTVLNEIELLLARS